MLQVAFVSPCRIFNPKDPDNEFSELWQDIVQGTRIRVAEKGGFLEVFSPHASDDPSEFLTLVKSAVDSKPEVIILPFAITKGELASDFYSLLNNFGGKLVAINIPPPLQSKRRPLLPSVAGYVGMNNHFAGFQAAFSLLYYPYSYRRFIKKIWVVSYESDHLGHELRKQGIADFAQFKGIRDQELHLGLGDTLDQLRKLSKAGTQSKTVNVGIITLDIKETEAVLDAEVNVPVIAMGLNARIAKAIEAKKILATFFEHPFEQGKLALDLAIKADPFEDYQEIFCGPTLVDKHNIAVFTSRKF